MGVTRAYPGEPEDGQSPSGLEIKMRSADCIKFKKEDQHGS